VPELKDKGIGILESPFGTKHMVDLVNLVQSDIIDSTPPTPQPSLTTSRRRKTSNRTIPPPEPRQPYSPALPSPPTKPARPPQTHRRTLLQSRPAHRDHKDQNEMERWITESSKLLYGYFDEGDEREDRC